MKLSVFGLGYVGVVTAACLSRDGHSVVGVDVSEDKVELINDGKSPVIEQGVKALVSQAVKNRLLRATTDPADAVGATDLAVVCVGTPSHVDGSLDLSYVRNVTTQIGEQLRSRASGYTVVVRSTMLPGSLRSEVLPLIEKASGRSIEDGINLLFHPEFLREGSAVEDFFDPPKIVVGECIKGSAAGFMRLYGDSYAAPRIVCTVEEAEMVKYCDNIFHAVKITFANEMGEFCHSKGIDSRAVMEIFCLDQKLNISAKYLTPGAPFGGSCLPKDLRAFLSAAAERRLRLPMLEGVPISNKRQLERILQMTLAYRGHRIGFYGISFKKGTDDLRESPYVELAEMLLGKGCLLSVYDERVQVSRLVGGNRSFVESHLPHLADLISDDLAVLDDCEVILLCHHIDNEQLSRWLSEGKRILDLTGRKWVETHPLYERIV